MNDVLIALWFFLPAGLANASPVFANKIPLLNRWKTPLDFGKSFRGKRIFGENKTFRGLVFGVLIAFVTIWLQHKIWQQFNPAPGFIESAGRLMHFYGFDYWYLGILFGFGALLGDAAESFLKRQAGVLPGHSWFPFDQTDYIIGGLLLGSLFAPLNARGYLTVIFVWTTAHLIASYIGYLVGLKAKPI